MQVPQAEPGIADKARELWNAARAVQWRPTFWQYGTDGSTPAPLDNGQPVRTPSASSPLASRLTTWAYWTTYPDASAKIAEGDTAASAAWFRINVAVNQLLDNEKLPNPNYNPTLITWPLLTAPTTIRGGSKFQAKRPAKGPQTRYHTGCDLAANLGAAVLAPEPGVIIAPNSGWEMKKVNGVWVGVKALLLKADSGRTWLLGGIRPDSAIVKKDDRVVAGQRLAEIGAYPLGDTMLHVSLYDSPLTEAGVNAQKSWYTTGQKPKNLIDPQPFLEAAQKNPRAALSALTRPMNEDIEGAEETEGTPEGEGPPDNKGKKQGLAIGLAAAALAALFAKGR